MKPTNDEIDALLSDISRGDWSDGTPEGTRAWADEMMSRADAAIRALRDQREADALPAGWVFFAADASFQSSDPRRQLSVMLIRDLAGRAWWNSLPDDEKEATPLYQTGAGMTINEAIRNAAAAMSAQGGSHD